MIKDKQSYRILVIEDNPGDFTIVEDFLIEQILNPVIVHAGSFKQASAILSSADPIFDVILLDLTLPDKSGQDLITEMFRITALCPIIILSGYSDIDFSIKSISLGIADYLLKDDLNVAILYKSIIYAIERKKTISQLKESEKRYSDLFHLSPQSMWVYDLDSLQFLNVNSAAIRNYGYTKSEFLSMTIKEIWPEEDIAIMEEAVNFFKKYDQPFTKGVYRHKRKNGDIIHVDTQCNTFYFNNKKAILTHTNDITERVQYIKAIEEQNKKLQDIAWIQSHIVRAPLARMMGIVSIVKGLKIITSAEHEEWIKHFEDSANELDNIIHDIVNKTESIDINITLDEF